MQKTEDLHEIEEYGIPPMEDYEQEFGGLPQQSGHSIIPLLQTACCAVILLALLFIKYQDAPKYDKVMDWFHQAIMEEIELPKFQDKTPESSLESPGEKQAESGKPESTREPEPESTSGQATQRV